MSYRNETLEHDEALARALQDEYEKEYRRRSMQQHLRQSQHRHDHSINITSLPTAPLARYDTDLNRPSPVASGTNVSSRQSQIRSSNERNPIGHQPSTSNHRNNAPYSQSIRHSSPSTVQPSFTANGISDEDFARRLQQEEEAAARLSSQARSSSNRRQPIYGPSTSTQDNGNLTVPIPSSNRPRSSGNAPSGVIVSGRILSDEELARRISQEEQDAALARNISVTNNQGLSSVSKSTRCCDRLSRFVSCIVSLVMLAVAGWLLWFYFGGKNSMPDFIPDPESFRKEDPFTNVNPGDTNRWKTKQDGLKMTLINALDTSWDEYFYQAVNDWDNGTPDSLDLKTQKSNPESVCKAETGYIKVCNGDYGATNWRGINKVLLENGYIYASAARMNEYYFSGVDKYQRQYTMCHEIGHGFGLPHTDENFYNKDLGNCMDYTNNPQGNMQPDDTNYIFLADLYGSLDGLYTSPPTPQGGAVENSAAVPESNVQGRQFSTESPHPVHHRHDDEGEQAIKKDEHHDGERHLRILQRRPETKRDMKLKLTHEMDSTFNNIAKFEVPHQRGWRKLSDSKYAEEYEFDLGDGYSVKYHMLLVL